MRNCVPIRDMKDTAGFASLVEASPEPITVTRNGYDTFVVMRVDDYAALCEQAAKARLLSRMARADAELASGDHEDGVAFTAKVRARYGL